MRIIREPREFCRVYYTPGEADAVEVAKLMHIREVLGRKGPLAIVWSNDDLAVMVRALTDRLNHFAGKYAPIDVDLGPETTTDGTPYTPPLSPDPSDD